MCSFGGQIEPLNFTYLLYFHFYLLIVQVAGWTQVYGDILTFATVRGAGGAAPATQPESLMVLFKAFLEGKPLSNNMNCNEVCEFL